MKKMLYIYILLQPILDIITGITKNRFGIDLSINIMLKGIAVLGIIVYLLFFNKSKYKKKSIIYLVTISFYFIIYFVLKLDLFSSGGFMGEVVYAFKYFYYIVFFLGLINIFDEYKYDQEKIYKYLLINLSLYALFIIIPYITGTGLYSYNQYFRGTRGWFSSANELSTIFSLLIPFSFYLLAKKTNLKKLFIIPISLITLVLVGTKASILSVILIILFFSTYFIIKSKNRKMYVLAIVFVIFSVIMLINFSPGMQILKDNIVEAELLIDEDSTIVDKALTYTLGWRRKIYINISDLYKEQNTINKLFGIGFHNREKINNKTVDKLIEMDAPDVLFRYGIIGFIIYFIPVIYVLVISFKKIYINKKINYYEYQNLFTVFMAIGISTFAGHVFGAPSASIYLSISLAILLTINDNTTKT